MSAVVVAMALACVVTRSRTPRDAEAASPNQRHRSSRAIERGASGMVRDPGVGAPMMRDSLKLSAEIVPHSFRHTFGTRLGEEGADAFTIMRLMGHSSVTISQRYVHPSPETVETAISRMEAISKKKFELGIELGIPNNVGAAKTQELS